MKLKDALYQAAKTLEEFNPDDETMRLVRKLKTLALNIRQQPNELNALAIMKDNPSKSFDAMTLMQDYRLKYNRTYDWHEFVNILDNAEAKGYLDLVSTGYHYDGMTRYVWKPTINKKGQ